MTFTTPRYPGHHPPSLPPDLSSLWKNMGKSKKWRRTIWFSQKKNGKKNILKEISAWKRWEGSKVKPQTTNIGPVLVVSIQFWRCASLTQIQLLEVVSRGASIQQLKLGALVTLQMKISPESTALCLVRRLDGYLHIACGKTKKINHPQHIRYNHM